MTKKLSFIEEAEFNGFKYRPNGILGNGFYGNGLFATLSEMEKNSKSYNLLISEKTDENNSLLNSEYFIESENKKYFYTVDITRLFSDLKEHDLHTFLNRFKDVFLSQTLCSIINRRRVFTKEAVKFIYTKLIKKEEHQEKKKGRMAS